MLHKKVLVYLSILFNISSFAQAPKYSNDFMNIGIGGRALGMSNSVVASTQDVTSGYWNPAGLLLIPSDLEVGLMHSSYFAGIATHNYLSVAFKSMKESALGFSFIRTGVDDIPNTIDLFDNNGVPNYDRIKSFSVSFNGLMISYARKMKIEGLRVGGNVKIIRNSMGEFADSWGFGLDAAAQFDYKKWKFGVLARDLTSTFNAWNFTLSDRVVEVWTLTGNEIPQNHIETTLPRVILGAARTFKIGDNFNTLIEANTDITFDGMRNVLIKSDPISIDPHAGVEFSYKNIAYVRGGIGNFQKTSDLDSSLTWSFQPNIGVGVNIMNRVSIDYALTDIGNASEALYSNVFSIKININRRRGSPSM